MYIYCIVYYIELFTLYNVLYSTVYTTRHIMFRCIYIYIYTT